MDSWVVLLVVLGGSFVLSTCLRYCWYAALTRREAQNGYTREDSLSSPRQPYVITVVSQNVESIRMHDIPPPPYTACARNASSQMTPSPTNSTTQITLESYYNSPPPSYTESVQQGRK